MMPPGGREDASRRRGTTRRGLLVITGLLLGVQGLRMLGGSMGRAPSLVPVDGLPPFRRLDGAAELSRPPVALVGLDGDESDNAGRLHRAEALRDDVCAALHGPAAQGPAVPLAVFSDIRCPQCRRLEETLAALIAADPDGLRIIRHELPIFGATSVLGARALVAAAAQDETRPGASEALRRRLMRAPVALDGQSLAALAEAAGLDAARLTRDMKTPATAAALQRSRALADLFAFPGTPATVIGRIVIEGAVPEATLRAVIAEERAAGPPYC